MFKKEGKPTFIINGFLESGKTEFISYTLSQPYFKTRGKTLLILCEDGEVEYNEELLKQTNTEMVEIDDIEDITPAKFMELNSMYKPERIIIEWNGMWDYRTLRLPNAWKLEQQITTIDGSTFNTYFNNMRSLLGEMIKGSEMIILNRCDDIVDDLPVIKRNLKMVNPNADIIFEGSEGEINMIFEDDLPFDLNADVIELDNTGYAVWYIDSCDNLQRYIGKKISYTAMVYKPKEFPKDYFVPGRMIMNCCAEDVQFFGFACKYDDVSSLQDKQWIKITAVVDEEYFEGYGEKGPVLKAVSIENAQKPKEEVISLT